MTCAPPRASESNNLCKASEFNNLCPHPWAEKGYTVVGFDFSSEAIEACVKFNDLCKASLLTCVKRASPITCVYSE